MAVSLKRRVRVKHARKVKQVDVDISYIVSCYDRPGDLIVCLGSLLRQTHRSFEVIVTDNGAPEFFKEHQAYHQVLQRPTGESFRHRQAQSV